MKLKDIKNDIHDYLISWLDRKIEQFIESNEVPIKEQYLKNIAHHFVYKNSDRIGTIVDYASIAIGDDATVEDLIKELMDLFINQNKGVSFRISSFLSVKMIENGLKLELPDNLITRGLFGDTLGVKFTTEDFMEILKIIGDE